MRAGEDDRDLGMRGSTLGHAVDHETVEQGWLIRLLSVVTDPNVAFVLMIVGLFGLIFEFSNPGAIAPGMIGALCLVLGF